VELTVARYNSLWAIALTFWCVQSWFTGYTTFRLECYSRVLVRAYRSTNLRTNLRTVYMLEDLHHCHTYSSYNVHIAEDWAFHWHHTYIHTYIHACICTRAYCWCARNIRFCWDV